MGIGYDGAMKDQTVQEALDEARAQIDEALVAIERCSPWARRFVWVAAKVIAKVMFAWRRLQGDDPRYAGMTPLDAWRSWYRETAAEWDMVDIEAELRRDC
jgi:hypothetical protein